MHELTKDEISLLLYFECVSVDNNGLIDGRRINVPEIEIANRWDEEGFLSFGRLLARDLTEARHNTHYVVLTDESWATAHHYRKQRGLRGVDNCKFHRKTYDV